MEGAMGKLDRKIALIAGGTSGIGLAAARLFCDEGARVTVTGLDPATVAQAREALGPGVDVIAADAASYQDTKNLFADLARSHGRLDILFINADAGGIAEVQDTSAFQGAFFILKRAIPLLSSGAAVILNTSLHELRSLTRCAAAELADRDIRVDAVSPGPPEEVANTALFLASAVEHSPRFKSAAASQPAR
jgi:NAD(P)-dependent dehydrogenase (short-subunit alcohol dehydrogenase family)